MHPPRFRLRTLMVAVAVAGVVLGSVHLLRLGREYERRAAQYAGRVRWAGDGRAELEARRRDGWRGEVTS
jgi:hypothetical protein